LCGECEAHVAGSIDELEDGGGGLVFFKRLDAQDAGVAAGAGGVAFADGPEELGKECERALWVC